MPPRDDALARRANTHARHARIARRVNLSQPVAIDLSPKSVVHPRRPALNKRGVRVVTNVRRDAMDANALSDVQCASGRPSRVVLTPLGWCQVCGR